jgi:hypothetical protein
MTKPGTATTKRAQTFNTNPAPIDLPPRCMLALNERAIQRPDLLSSTIITGVIGIQREYPAKWVFDVEIEKLKADFFLNM